MASVLDFVLCFVILREAVCAVVQVRPGHYICPSWMSTNLTDLYIIYGIPICTVPTALKRLVENDIAQG